jgi:hypothetical protein
MNISSTLKLKLPIDLVMPVVRRIVGTAQVVMGRAK